MTRIDVTIERLVLRGVPVELAEGLGPLVEARLSELATAERRGQEPPGWASEPVRRGQPVTDREGLADRVARDTWASARAHLGGGTPR